MNQNAPTLEEWRTLHDAAIRVKELAPWQWMEEIDVFGVQNPETNDLGFVSVMGMLGEHFAISLYLGARALYQFWEFQRDPDPPDRLLEFAQLQASFEDRGYLNDRDRQVIKSLGLSFRGSNAWPLFRSYRPGYMPWFLEAAEARFLTCALTQVLDVAPRFRGHSLLLGPAGGAKYLVRVPRKQDDTIAWTDSPMDVPPPEPSSIHLMMDYQMLAQLKRLSRSNLTLEVDVFLFPGSVRDPESDRPLIPYVLLVVDSESGLILGTQLLQAVPSLEAMWGQVDLELVRVLASNRILPARIKVRSAFLHQLLEPLAAELRFKLTRSRTLPALDEARDSLFDHLARRGRRSPR